MELKAFGRADRERVVRIVEHLRKAYEEFLNTEGEVPYIDGFMAAHNFHKLIVQDIEEKAEIKEEKAKVIFRRMAVDTFRLGLLDRDKLPADHDIDLH